ncbi:EscF/YscF/HrpA family type III secretion system needle major subunit [Paraburkholderia sp. SIMBA_055]|jgi:type III secretion apparatus needle protein|uniref:Type III secretion apparatus needle protein n=1 Tax=Paraburkholderia graminis TaxID=60548 RepID=A0ABD5C8W5_9BURK|nr:EscF/YscF/HrpA family type III secretion system needle major subunit [Paraburkholderia graminis]MDR6201316.1 type III secretion apparatus needle protein [Paraburkholderia graminis]
MSISSSDPNQIYNTLEQQTAQLGQEVTSMAQNVDMTDPNQALKFQRATMKYQTLIGANSGYIDMLKRLLSGIIQKI